MYINSSQTLNPMAKLIKGSPLTRLRKNHSCIAIEHNISVPKNQQT